MNIKHPLPIGTNIRANKPKCACKGGGTVPVVGTVLKIITNQTGIWYYLDGAGVTVQDQWVTEVL